jgi:para-aminobenzoate synthetase component I
MLGWAKQFNIFCFLDNRHYSVQPQQYECMLAAGVTGYAEPGDLKDLDAFLKQNHNWVFGHLSYTLKDRIHFPSQKSDRVGFPPFYFFAPQFVLLLRKNELEIVAANPQEVYNAVAQSTVSEDGPAAELHMEQQLSREQYIEQVKKLQAHILRGDCYEINFCQEFFSENATIDPFAIFQKLVDISPNPFSAFYRLGDKFLLCASPERFLMKQGSRIISQPIKGTIKRNLQDRAEDYRLREELRNSPKDQSENVMVVDLVRNDIARICEDDSVKVDELFGIYSYPQVHQMISTVSGQLRKDIKFSEILQATFPMGSMTGAPKHRVMELIDEYEKQSRGLFSGSVGYFTPDGDFDFNVVIRSILYNASEKYLSYQVGSGITFYSDPGKEWEECLLKAEAINRALGLRQVQSE